MKRIAHLGKSLVAVAAAALLVMAALRPAEARSLVSDTEVENIIRELATPVFQTAGLTPEAVDIYIVQDDALNAFVAGGQNIFFYTGLLMATETPEQLLGVIAHETGHIAGGHLARTSEAMRDASKTALIGMVLGAAAAIATGRADAAAAVMQGSMGVAQGNLLQYSQTQESAADHAAIRYLESNKESSVGMLQFLETLSGQELLTGRSRSPYASTHPLTQDRINFVREQVTRSPHSENRLPEAVQQAHKRMVAKLTGFIQSPARTFKAYPEEDRSLPARYARAIATYKQPDAAKAVLLIDELLAEYPDDPYFHEFRGQVLFESGNAASALTSYSKAHALLPKAPLIELELARVQLALNTADTNMEARRHLESVVQALPDRAFAWRQLAIAYGRTGEEGLSALALAEEAFRSGKKRDAAIQANRALQKLKPQSAAWLRAQDIEELARADLGEKKRKP